MRAFVLVYERQTGDLRVEEFPQGSQHQAFARRSLLQRTAGPSTEVVVLHADSLDDLRTTHRRYFETVGEMAARVTG